MRIGFVLAALLCALASGASADSRVLSERAQSVKSRLKSQFLPYWLQKQRADGAVILADSQSGPMSYGSDGVSIITQSRVVWTFSHAHLAGYSDSKNNYLGAAKKAAEFLESAFLDKRNGGYFSQVDLAGKVVNDRKSIYAQGFVVYGLVELGRASGERKYEKRALNLWKLMREKAYAKAGIFNGAFEEHFTRDWIYIADPNDKLAWPEIPGLRSANAHLHLMEAGAELYDLTRARSVKRDLGLLISDLDWNFYPAKIADSQSYFSPTSAGQYPNIPADSQLSYGHIIEAAWLIERALQLSNYAVPYKTYYQMEGLFDKRFRQRIDETLAAGFDHKNGGMWTSGSVDGAVVKREKWWWPQYETLAALTVATKKFPENQAYQTALLKTLDWIENFQTDRDFVPFETVGEDGKVKNGSKAHFWKANYHDGRALMMFVAAFER